ncbi:hypothetical protein BUALT_Bualt03G0002400 [Buddleja alternifolia]|uniref:Mce/MlaD domain-containing protein n=1 Tax=Buddleja alternifolia TaxID=168488 RepID=A0AAV6XWQ6_9LAMI|nr:hypothetical protein BUALT_Bualt03G0002400 [Buddleja alternifolia]
MGVNSLLYVSTSPPRFLRSYSITPPPAAAAGNGKLTFLPCLKTTPPPPPPPLGFRDYKRKRFCVKATSSADDDDDDTPSSPEWKNLLSVLLGVPRAIWRQTLRPLSDFGFGTKSIWEGGVGLFLVSGAVLLALSLAWLRAFQLRSKFRKYLAVFEFDQASGICTGTPVRIRGVNVGNVVRVNPSLRSIEAVVEVDDDKVIIPRNALIEVNQSGLLMETLIDITPRDPIPAPSVGPLDTLCVKEGLIVCDRQKIKGHQGVSLDALVGIFTRIGREVEEIGVANTYSLAERVATVIDESRPLLAKKSLLNLLQQYLGAIVCWSSMDILASISNFRFSLVTLFFEFVLLISQIKAMAENIEPLLAEVHDSGLLKEVENLTKSLTRASEDLRYLVLSYTNTPKLLGRRVQSSIMTPENTELIRKSIYSLIFTLKNIENISSDILGVTGDEATRRNLKLLIKSLSRLLC